MTPEVNYLVHEQDTAWQDFIAGNPHSLPFPVIDYKTFKMRPSLKIDS